MREFHVKFWKMELLKKLCSIHAPSAEELPLKEFILSWVKSNMKNWKVKPEILEDFGLQDSIVLVFGKPRTAVFAHMDSTGFTVRYKNEIISIGGPYFKNGDKLVGNYKNKQITTKLVYKKGDEKIFCDYKEILPAGTTLTYKVEFKTTEKEIIAPYLDNRLGVWLSLNIAKNLENGILVFSCVEEHGGGNVEKIAKIIYEKYSIRQALISDITWATDGIFLGKGVVVSLRDKYIPRKIFVDKIRNILNINKLKYQLEVESLGSSDGGYLQKSAYPIDWCFIGVPEEGNHSSQEKVNVKDVISMQKTYELLMREL